MTDAYPCDEDNHPSQAALLRRKSKKEKGRRRRWKEREGEEGGKEERKRNKRGITKIRMENWRIDDYCKHHQNKNLKQR